MTQKEEILARTLSAAVALDAVRINYSDVPAVSNPSANQAPLGADNGPGFGWNDVSVVKLGAVHAYDDRLTLRAGASRVVDAVGLDAVDGWIASLAGCP